MTSDILEDLTCARFFFSDGWLSIWMGSEAVDEQELINGIQHCAVVNRQDLIALRNIR